MNPKAPAPMPDISRALTIWMWSEMCITTCILSFWTVSHMYIESSLQLIYLPQPRALESHSSWMSRRSRCNKPSTDWTSTSPPWWWSSHPALRRTSPSSPPWPWCKPRKSSPVTSSTTPRSASPELASLPRFSCVLFTRMRFVIVFSPSGELVIHVSQTAPRATHGTAH